jgi:hypothetical protein
MLHILADNIPQKLMHFDLVLHDLKLIFGQIDVAGVKNGSYISWKPLKLFPRFFRRLFLPYLDTFFDFLTRFSSDSPSGSSPRFHFEPEREPLPRVPIAVEAVRWREQSFCLTQMSKSLKIGSFWFWIE